MIVLVIGGQSGSIKQGNLEYRYIPHVADRSELAKYLAAADLCVLMRPAPTISHYGSASLLRVVHQRCPCA